MEASGNPSGMDPCVEERECRVIVKVEPPDFEPTSLTFYGQISDAVSHGLNSSGNGVCSSNLSQSSASSSECSSQSTAMLGKDCEYSGAYSNEIDGCAQSSKIYGGCASTGNHERKQDETTENFITELPGVPQGTLLGTTTTSVRLDKNKVEPPAFDPTSVRFNSQESSKEPPVESQSYGSNHLRNGICSLSLLQSNTFSFECTSQSTAMLGKDCEHSGAHSSKIDFGKMITGVNHDERKEDEMPVDLTIAPQGVPVGPLLGTATTSIYSDKFEAEPPEINLTSIRLNDQEISEQPQEECQSFGPNTSRNSTCSSNPLHSNIFSAESSPSSTAVLVKDCRNFSAECMTGTNHDESIRKGTTENISIESPGVLQGALLGIPTTSIYSDKVEAEAPEINLTSIRLNDQERSEQPQEECHSFGPNTSRNNTCSSNPLHSNIFSAESSPSSTAVLVKDCKNFSAECKTGTNHDESISKGTTENISIESPGVLQGALLGTPTTSFCPNEMRTNHSMTSLEKTLELVKKRKNGMSKYEGESCKKSKRKRKPTKPTKSMEYCNEAERMVVGNQPSTKETASCSSDQVMLMEADSSALNDEQFSQFSTQHMHCLLNFKRYECLQCGRGFASKKAMNVHIRTHSEEKPYWCTECDMGFTEHHLYMAHMQSHRPYECDECGADFADSTTLQNHKLLHLQSKNFKCSVCPKMFKQRAGLASHMMNAHPQSHTDDKPFWCKECNKGFTQNHSYKAHLRIHSGERPYLCKECGAAFADNKTLQNHKALHSDEKTFKCTICPKMFRQRAGLACHMKTHTDEKPFMCELCGQSFKTKSTLKNHQRIHSEEKPYQCPLCPQAFKQRAGLACHSKVHDKGNPY